jgi:putative intracellular protease/amidase
VFASVARSRRKDGSRQSCAHGGFLTGKFVPFQSICSTFVVVLAMKILSLVFPGFTFIDLAAPMQALMMIPEAKSQIVWQEKGAVASDAGVDVHATEDFSSCWKDLDILFVPGNKLALFKQLQDDRTLAFISDIGSRATWVTSVCNGSLTYDDQTLRNAGLRLTYDTHFGSIADLKDETPGSRL